MRLPRLNKAGKHTIYLRITQGKASRYRSLKRHVLPDEWDEATSRFTRKYPDYRVENDVMRMYEQRASDILRRYERDSIPFSFEKFDAEMWGKKKATISPGIAAHADAIAEQMRLEGRDGNAAAYDALAHIVRQHKPDDTLAALDHPWIQRFEHYLRAERRQQPGTIDYYLRTLRSACNKAVKAGTMPAGWKPFSGYSTAHLRVQTAKRALHLDQARRLIECRAESSDEALAQDLFAFSLYARGMNMVDIAHLKIENISGGRIEYTRRKTGTVYSVALNEHTRALLEKYKGTGPYSLPILDTFHDTPKRKRERIHRVMVAVNKALRSIAQRLGIPTKGLSFYAARHTYASALKERGVSTEVISQSLGHADLRTTQIYLRSFDNSVLDEADRLLL